MGKKKTKTEQTNRPIYSAQIEGAAGAQQGAYNRQLPAINEFSDNLMGLSGDLMERYRQGDPAINAARGYVTDTLSGDPASNPYLDDMLDISNDRIRNQMQARMATRGQTGGSGYTDLITRALAQNETGMRYQDYDRTMQRRAQAAGMAPGVAAGDYLTLAPALQTGQMGAMLPLQASLANSAGIGGLLGQYQNVKGTQQQSGGLFGDLLGTAAQIGSAAIMACDVRVKENIAPIGETPGGVPLYSFNYIGDNVLRWGPMAQEVAVMQPDALGPTIDGMMTVRMGALV